MNEPIIFMIQNTVDILRKNRKTGNTYYTYDSKYGGYPTGRIEKKGNTYKRYNSKYGGSPVGRVMKK
jgi:hypothetical protein